MKKKFILVVRFIELDDFKKERGDINIGGVIILYDLNGFGEDGKFVVVLVKEKYNEKDGYNKYVFNEYVSVKIFFEWFILDIWSFG